MTRTTKQFTIADEPRISRRRKPTRDETLWLLCGWGIETLSRYHRENLTREELLNAVRDRQLRQRRAWEHSMFGKALTSEWNAGCTIPVEHLTT